MPYAHNILDWENSKNSNILNYYNLKELFDFNLFYYPYDYPYFGKAEFSAAIISVFSVISSCTDLVPN